MADKFKKIDKEFQFTDSSLNTYSYRLLTSGYLMSEFQKNPIGYRMHKRDEGVVVKWVDFRKEGDKIYAKAVVNLSHPKGEQTVDEIENGFLNAVSLGQIVALEISTDPKDYLPDQKGPTVTKWFNRELSLVDIPGNYNALTELVDVNELPINLSDFKPQFKNMKQIFLTPAQLALIPNLKAEPDQPSVDVALANLVAEAAKVPDLIVKLNAATIELANLKSATIKGKVKDILDKAVTEKKITAETKAIFETQYSENPDGLQALMATMKPFESIVNKLTPGASEDVADLSDKYTKMDKAGTLENLKASNMDEFKKLYKARWNKEYAE